MKRGFKVGGIVLFVFFELSDPAEAGGGCGDTIIPEDVYQEMKRRGETRSSQ